jgi:hypothetical protein
MKIIYFDTIGGLSGDMALGALVNAGVPLDDLSNSPHITSNGAGSWRRKSTWSSRLSRTIIAI